MKVKHPEAPPVEEGEALLVVQFVDPMRKEIKVRLTASPSILGSVVFSSNFILSQSQEVVIRANEKLTALRDVIYCHHDAIANASELSVSSGYFCIEVCALTYPLNPEPQFLAADFCNIQPRIRFITTCVARKPLMTVPQ